MMMSSRDRKVSTPAELHAFIRAGQAQVAREIAAMDLARTGGRERLRGALRVDQGAKQ